MSRIVDVEPLDCLAWKDGEHGTTFDDGVLWVLEKISELPAVQPREPAEWIWKLADNGWADHICSNCGYTENTDIHVRLDWKYCPGCGSYMRRKAK